MPISLFTLENKQRNWLIMPKVFGHQAALNLVRRKAARDSHLPITSYSTIARSLLVMDETVKARMKKKFDICFVMAKEGVAFRKYPSFHALEERHGVDLGFAYKTDESAKTFTHFIAESQRQCFLDKCSFTAF